MTNAGHDAYAGYLKAAVAVCCDSWTAWLRNDSCGFELSAPALLVSQDALRLGALKGIEELEIIAGPAKEALLGALLRYQASVNAVRLMRPKGRTTDRGCTSIAATTRSKAWCCVPCTGGAGATRRSTLASR